MFTALSRLLLAFAAAIALAFNDGDVGVVGETIEETQNIYIEGKDAKAKIDCHRRSS